MAPTTDWQRVSPLAIVFFFFRSLPHLINLWPVVIGGFAAGETARGYMLFYGIPAVALFLLLGATLQYLFFRFRLEPDRIQLQTGMLHRKRLTLDFERVQEAEITHPFYFRPLGLVSLGLESAGSTQQEVDIPGIKVGTAESLREHILERAKSATRDSPDEPLAESQTEPVGYELHLPPAEVARYGLMHNGLLFLAPIAAPLGQYLGPAMEHWVEWIQGLPLMRAWEASETLGTVWVFIAVGLVSILLGIVVLFAVSAGLALIYYWDYRLVRIGDRFQARSGLGTQRTRGFRLHKLQKVTIKQGMLARLLRRYTLSISKAGAFAQGNAHDKQRFIIPVLTEAGLGRMRAECSLPGAHWTRVHPLYVLATTISLGTFLLLLGGVSLLLSPLGTGSAVGLSLLAYPLVALMAWRHWQQLGYFLEPDWLALRQGFIGHKEQWLPTGKIQKLKLSEPPFLRWLGLAHLTVWSTDGPLLVAYLPKSVATRLRDQLMARVVSYQKAWF